MAIVYFRFKYVKNESNDALLKRVERYIEQNLNKAKLKNGVNSFTANEHFVFTLGKIKLWKLLAIEADIV